MSTEDPVLRQVFRDFVSACHILHHHRVLDAYGHLSVRHPHKPERFFMSRYIAPAIVTSERDLVEYYVEDAEPVDPGSPKGYSERCIHSEVLKRFPTVNAVIHSHSEAVVPYSINAVPFRACFHMAGFLGTETPIFDIAKYYQPSDRKDMLVRNTHLGSALASYFSGTLTSPSLSPAHAVVLMRGHGFTVQGPSIADVVLRAIYTQQNAGIQTTSLLTHAAHFGPGPAGADVGGGGASVTFLSEEEGEGATEMTRQSALRPWRLWVREVEALGLYVNMA